MLPQGTLKGQSAIVTGGGTGIGRAISLALAGLGADVVVASRKMEHLEPVVKEVTALGTKGLAVPTDIRDAGQVEALVKKAKEAFGRIDILVNNAAGNFICPTVNLSVNGWKAVVDIVLNGTFYCTRAAGIEMIAQKRGNVVSIIAPYAWTGAPMVVHSVSAKAGVLGLMRSLALEWAQFGLRLNAVAPGPIVTEGAAGQLFPTPEIQERIRKSIPVGRFGTPEEIANAVCYLVSDYGSFINGEVLTLDGGWWLNSAMNFGRAFE